jgi:hypothetical protein
MTVASSTTAEHDGRRLESRGIAARILRPSSVLTLDAVWLAATLTFAFLVGTLLQADQTDYWWTVKLGEGLLAGGGLPAADPLAFTSTRQPYVEQQWLAQVVLAAAHQVGGLEAALVLRGLLLAGSVGLLFYLCRARGASAAAGTAACGLALLSIVGGAAIRPQLLAIPLFVFFIAGTTVWLRHAWVLAALPLAMVVWANTHGSFPLGLALIAAAIVGTALTGLRRAPAPAEGVPPAMRPGVGESLSPAAALRRLLLLFGLCVLAPLVNPYGLGIVPWLVDYLTFNTGSTGLATLSLEWLPTSIATAHGMLFFLGVFLLVAVLLRVGPPSAADCLRLLGFAVLALQAVRSTVWWALVMAPVLAWGLSRLPAEARRSSAGDALAAAGGAAAQAAARRAGVPAVNAALILGFVLLAVLSLPWLRSSSAIYPAERWPVVDPRLPTGAADFAATLPATRLYNTMDWGGYLAWRLGTRQRILVDGRFQLYPPDLYRDYFQIASAGPGWADRLATYGVDALVVSREAQRELLRAVEANGSWVALYCDADAAVYVPRASADGRAVPCGPSTPPAARS